MCPMFRQDPERVGEGWPRDSHTRKEEEEGGKEPVTNQTISIVPVSLSVLWPLELLLIMHRVAGKTALWLLRDVDVLGLIMSQLRWASGC